MLACVLIAAAFGAGYGLRWLQGGAIRHQRIKPDHISVNDSRTGERMRLANLFGRRTTTYMNCVSI
jgi:hypothetical protein